MINFEVFFKITYGLYIVSAGDKNRANAFISNTVFQVTAEPAQFAICCNKNNFTAEFIQKHKSFAVSILEKEASSELFGKFGYKSGKDFDKMKDSNIIYGDTGVPIVLDESIAYFVCNVVQTVDVGSHLLFIGQLINAELIDASKEQLTYAYYRQTKKGVAPKNAPTYIDQSKIESKPNSSLQKKYKCPACGYIYDDAVESTAFNNLPNDWVCPVCGSEKSDFIEV